MTTGLGTVVGTERRVTSNWASSGGWAWRELGDRLEVQRHGGEPVAGAMTWTELDDMLGAELADVRAWAEGLDELRHTHYWTRSRPVEFELVHVPWTAEGWWRDAESEHYEARIWAWTRFREVLTAHIDRIERESGMTAPTFEPAHSVVCAGCGQVCSDFTLRLNHGEGILPRLHGRPELLCAQMAVRINRASFYVSGRKSRTSRTVDGVLVVEETRPEPSWDEGLLELADYGWTFALDGTPIAPAGWPKAVTA